jgi:pyrroloquinoline quinone biosynthesis protein D
MTAAAISGDAKPRLARGVRLTHNEAHGGWVLLAPERIFQTDAIAVEILKRCTGEAPLAAVIDDLVKTYGAPREQIAQDVEALLASLADKKLIEFSHA